LGDELGSGSSSTDDVYEELHQLGGGYSYDGVYLYDPEDNIIEDHELPPQCIDQYMLVLAEDQEEVIL
jgi:hydroxymethylpyrimidine pyrophosphatase-like HAD family hydrolase